MLVLIQQPRMLPPGDGPHPHVLQHCCRVLSTVAEVTVLMSFIGRSVVPAADPGRTNQPIHKVQATSALHFRLASGTPDDAAMGTQLVIARAVTTAKSA